jgi:hypothetical protein
MIDEAPDPLPKAAPAGRKPQVRGRDDRLKAALKANLARRKAQARARAVPDDNNNEPEADPTWTRS